MAKSGKKIMKNKGKYLKYRNSQGTTRPQRTGVNKKSGKNTGSPAFASVARADKISRLTIMVHNHRNPEFAIRNLVPSHLIHPVAFRLADGKPGVFDG